MSEEFNGLHAIVEAAKKNSNVGKEININDETYVLLAEGYELEKIEDPTKPPAIIEKTVSFETMDSFLDYFNRFANESSTILANRDEGSFKGILDHPNSSGETDHEKHIAKYACPKTVEWSTWLASNKKVLSQHDFAKFIEDNINEIMVPDGSATDTKYPTGAEMLEIAMTLSNDKKVRFSSGLRLDNGQVQLSYHEEIDGKAGTSGQLQIPQLFNLGIKLYEGGEPYAIEARFRYRISEGQLSMWYELVRPHKVIESAFDDIYIKIKEGIETGHIYRGTAIRDSSRH